MSLIHVCSHAQGKYPDRSGPGDFLTYGADQIADLGFTGVKVFLSPDYATKYPGQTWGGSHTTLTQLASDAAFGAVFGDARLTTFVINHWSFANGINNPWTVDWSPTQQANEYTELKALSEYLLTTYPDKTFYFINSEADWALLGAFVPTAETTLGRPERMAAFLRTQTQAIRDARATVPSTAKVLHGVEVNLVMDRYGRRVTPDVLRLCDPDVVSFSSYEVINATTADDQVASEAEIDRRMRLCVARVRAVKPGIPLIVGEYGFNEADASFVAKNLNVGQLMQKFFDVSDALGITVMTFWQVYDNEESSPGVPRGYYIYKPDTTLGEQGTKYAAIL